MPREYVYTEGLNAGDEAPQFAVSVGWSRHGFVQVATIRNGSEHSGDPGDGLYTDLDRDQINRLIRLLRKARDQAFGRDE